MDAEGSPDVAPGSARRPASRELDAVLDLIVDQQSRPDRNAPSLGVSRPGVLSELQALDPAWADTVRVVDGSDGVLGAVVAEWDVGSRFGHVHGPWVAVDDDEWVGWARVLVDVALAQIPSEVTRRVLSGVAQHRCLAALAGQMGWQASEPNHVLVAAAEVIGSWPTEARGHALCPMASDDVDAVAELHDVEFPATYFSAEQLAARSTSGDQVVLVAHGVGGSILGYVAGQIQPDGDAYIDFVAVAPTARRAGLGRQLVAALCRALVPASTTGRVCLTVQDRREPAIALYEAMGFESEMVMVGYEAPRTSDM
ncbi:GNAT family N-acetyltransferase [Actinospongicola halichondriae]|uniref:GNAT family N-acetyltransferase n=1 Tax=Actinospongicola halichondriae TaxID=3236844 RepID=UPI003D3EE69F